MKTPLSQQIAAKAQAIFPIAKAMREHLHQHPELSWQESETAKFIQKTLGDYGIRFEQNIATHGIVALIEGQDPSSRCMALRADMDALPIQEINECAYKSSHAGVMHACGHDVHMACLLGAAIVLQDLRTEFTGTIKLIFQPSEEKQPSGAEAMIACGVLENPSVDFIVGMHVTPELEVGKIGFRTGQFMASADEVYLTVKGKGGHAAQPHKVVDPILMSAHILVALQQIVSRHANPNTPTVLSFGDIQGHGATNIIPYEVKLKGTLRTFDEVWRKEIHIKIQQMAQGIARSMGGDCEVEIPAGLPFVANDAKITALLKTNCAQIFDAQNLVEMDLRMGSEDFGFYSQVVPATFLRLGTGKPNETPKTLHSNTFDIDSQAILYGIQAFCASIL